MDNACQAVLLVHGIGDQRSDWAEPILDRFSARLRHVAASVNLPASAVAPDAAVAVHPAWWAEVLQSRQRVLAGILRGAPEIAKPRSLWPGDWWAGVVAWLRQKERRFIAEFIGDVIGYRDPGAAAEIQSALLKDLDRLAEKTRRTGTTPGERVSGGKIPLTILAHSLGSVIVSDFIWDQTRARQAADLSGFHPRFELRNLFTIGSPLALFSLSYGGPEAFNQPIAVEHPDGRWVNIFDKDDPVAMSLKPLNAAYDRVVWADASVDAGPYLLSHAGYFTHDAALDIAAAKIVLDRAADARLRPPAQIAAWAGNYDAALALS